MNIDAELAKLADEKKRLVRADAQIEKRKREVNRRWLVVRAAEERLNLMKLIGQEVALKPWTNERGLAGKRLMLTKVGRTRAHIDADGQLWNVPIGWLKAKGAGLEAGMILSIGR